MAPITSVSLKFYFQTETSTGTYLKDAQLIDRWYFDIVHWERFTSFIARALNSQQIWGGELLSVSFCFYFYVQLEMFI